MQRGEHQASDTFQTSTVRESEECKESEESLQSRPSPEKPCRLQPSLDELLADADETCPEFKSTRRFFGRLVLSFARFAISRVEKKLSEDVPNTQETGSKLAFCKILKSVLKEGQEEMDDSARQ